MKMKKYLLAILLLVGCTSKQDEVEKFQHNRNASFFVALALVAGVNVYHSQKGNGLLFGKQSIRC